MIQIRFFSILFLLLLAAASTEARQNEVEIKGTTGELNIPAAISAQIMNANSDAESSEIAIQWLAESGYFDASVDSISTDDSQLRLFVREGCQYHLHSVSVEIEGDDSQSEFPFPLSDSEYTGDIFTSDLVQKMTRRWLSASEEGGYYMGEFQIDEVLKNMDSCSISLTVTFLPGEQLAVRGVRFEGVLRNNPEYLVRISGIREGETLSPGLFEKGRQNLINSGLFDEVFAGELIFVNGDPHILYVVEEQQLNFFDGLIGYVPDVTGSGNIAGYGDILLRNTLADGNILDLRYEQLQPLVSKLNVRAEQQFIGGSPVRAGIGFNFTQQDSSYLVRTTGLNSAYRIFSGFEITGHIRAERSSVSQAGSGEANNSALNSRANFYGIGFNVRYTDRFRVPTRGYDTRVMLERGRRFINDERFVSAGDNLSFTQTILKADVRGYIPLGNRQVLAPRVQGMFLESSEYLITDLFRFGGAESMRGFREDQFRASYLVWGEMEGRYLLDRSSFLFLFGAYGIYNRPRLINEKSDQLAVTDNLMSLGFGLAFQSPLGIIKFSYAISPDEDVSSGKVHVGITTGL